MSWINEYIYLIEKYAVRETELIDCSHITSPKRLYIICYHVFTESKYPFIQFMLEKDDTSILGLPFIEINADTHGDIDTLVTNKIIKNIDSIIQNIWSTKNVNYKGLINDSYERIYALVDITNVDIRHIQYMATCSNIYASNALFGLASEIINFGCVYDLNVNENVKELLNDLPELGVLYDPNKKKPYPLPDVMYSGSFFQNVIYSSLVGPSKRFINDIGRSCYYFNTQFKNAFLDGGWANETFYVPKDVIDKTSNYKKYLRGGIARYALFPENFLMVEVESSDIILTKEILDTLNETKQVYIVQRLDDIDDINVVILVRDYDSFVPLSYCEIDMKTLGDKYDIKNTDNYKLL